MPETRWDRRSRTILQVDALSDRFEQLRDDSQRFLINFLDSEARLGLTFTEIAVSARNDGHMEHFKRSKEAAEKAIAAIKHFLPRIEDPQTQSALADRCEQLARAVAAI